MIFITHYNSPIGDILLAAKNEKLIGLWLENQKYYCSTIKEEVQENSKDEVLIKTKKWLDRYFNHEQPNIKELDLELIGTDFRKKVWNILMDIPYGQVTTYKEIAKKIALEKGIKQMSTQAIGSAIGHNPISIIIPCHRVVGTSGSLTGYAGGIMLKKYLLEHEKVNMDKLFIPKKSSV